MKFSQIVKYSLYTFAKRRPVDKGSFLSLYKSTVFNGLDIKQNLNKQQSNQRYKQFLPFMLLGCTQAWKNKVLVTALDFNPQTQTLKVTSVRPGGIIDQQFHIDKIIPITYADMRAYNKTPEPILPPYIDGTMTYYNRFNQDIYVFQRDGTWNEQVVNHQKLSLDSRLDQKSWFDRQNAI